MTTLHCFANEDHTVVAESMDEALQNWDAWTFTTQEGYDAEEWEEIHDIQQIRDDYLMALFIEDELKNKPEGVEIDGTVWKATAGAWAESQGRGLLCSVEF